MFFRPNLVVKVYLTSGKVQVCRIAYNSTDLVEKALKQYKAVFQTLLSKAEAGYISVDDKHGRVFVFDKLKIDYIEMEID